MAQVRRLAPRRTAAANPTMMQNTALNSAVRCELIKLLGARRLRGHSPPGTGGAMSVIGFLAAAFLKVTHWPARWDWSYMC